MNKNLTEVYYQIYKDEEEEVSEILTTDKEYWNTEHCIDDGSGQHYMSIYEAMNSIGCYELTDSVFELNLPINTVISEMRLKGFNMIEKQMCDLNGLLP